MKRKLVCLLSTAVIVSILSTGFSVYSVDNSMYTTYSGFKTSEVPVLPEKEVHPSLWFNSSDIEKMRSKKDADSYAKQLWDTVFSSPELSMPFPSEVKSSDSGEKIRKYYGDISRIAKYNAFAWLMTKQVKYRTKAINALKKAYTGPIYSMPPQQRGPVDELRRGPWLQNFCDAYDWMYNDLSPEENTNIRAKLKKEASVIYDNLEVWAPRPHNHLSKPAWGLGSAALTLSSEPEAKEWLRKSLYEVNRNTSYFFSSDGVYREGSHYFMFSLVNMVPFLWNYKNVSGVDNFKIYKPAFEWALIIRNGRGWMPNIEGSWLKPAPLHMVAAAYMKDSTPLNSSAKLGNLLQWSYFKTDISLWDDNLKKDSKKDMQFPEKKKPDTNDKKNPPEKDKSYEKDKSKMPPINSKGLLNVDYTGSGSDHTWLLDEYMLYRPEIKQIAPNCSATVFLDEGGQTIFRNKWAYKDPKSRYLLFHGVAESDNQYNYDHLSFTIHAQDQLMASDAGYTRQDFSDPIRETWYMQGEAHNTVLADGKAPQDININQTPLSKYNIDTSFFDFQQKEAVYQNGNKIARSVAFPEQDYFVISDYLSGNSNSKYDLLLHGGRGKMSGEGDFRLWTYDTDRYGSASKLASWVLTSSKANYTDKSGEVCYIKGDYGSFGYLDVSCRTNKAMFMQILIPLGVEEKVPSMENLSSNDYIGAAITKNNIRDIYLQQQDSNEISAKGLSTDARFIYFRGNEKTPKWMFKEGTKLSYNNTIMAVSSKPVCLAFDFSSANKYEGEITGITSAVEIKIKNLSGKNVSKLTLNGKSLKFSESSGYCIFDVSEPGKVSIEFIK
ncbi:MAG: DUF4962 domain-containing protein [Clostridia bacterium]|nr:DUF4962 domain-containing protein [Clostridia bacterium]